jgi:carbonic anhydrase
MKTLTKEMQENLTPKDAHDLLVEGNKRFLANLKHQRDLKQQVLDTSAGQYPFAVILSCIDSRVPVELVFDQGIGDVFSVRVAGNIINDDILGSMEYGCKVAGSKIVVVLGHTNCGAVTAACDKIELGNVTHLLKKIEPAVDQYIKSKDDVTTDNIERVAKLNVFNSIKEIRAKSPILVEMEKKNEIEIIGAKYDVKTGKVDFFEESLPKS